MYPCKLFHASILTIVGFSGMSTGLAETVTVRNFVRAETDNYLRNHVERVGLGKFRHYRTVASIEDQRVVRMNRDTIYSAAVFDLTHPVTITKPDTGERFQSLHTINQDHYTKMIVYKPGDYILTREDIGSRYAFVIIRTLVDANDPEDVKAVGVIQERVATRQAEIGRFEVPDWNKESLNRLRDAVNVLASTATDNTNMFGDIDEVDPVMHMLGAAYGWGGLPPQDAIYVSETPKQADGTTPHVLTVKDVPVDAFWSVSLYNAKGFFEKNRHNAYVINDRNAEKNQDGSISIHFGGDPTQVNFLPITPNWNYTVRLYRPRPEILDGSWTFPIAKPMR